MDDIQKLFKETIAEFMENGLNVKLDDELGCSKYDYKNKDTDNNQNGHSSKILRTNFGDVEVSIPRDRKGKFEPQIQKKNQANIGMFFLRIPESTADISSPNNGLRVCNNFFLDIPQKCLHGGVLLQAVLPGKAYLNKQRRVKRYNGYIVH